MKHDASPRTLDIYVTPECFGCERARQLANEVRTWHMPGVEVRIIDLSDPENVQPDAVFAVPTYLLDGTVISLGNPEPDWLCRQLTE